MNSKAIRKQLLAAVAMVLVAAVALGSSTYAWFAANRRVTATGMQVTATTSSSLVISTQLNVANRTTVSLASSTNSLTPVTHDTSITVGNSITNETTNSGLLKNTNPTKVNSATGYANSSDALTFTTALNDSANNLYYYQDYKVFIASAGSALTEQKLQAYLWTGANMTADTPKATSVDFYVSEDSTATVGKYMGTLNLSTLTAEANADGVTYYTGNLDITLTDKTIPQNGQGNDFIQVTMRVYYDGDLQKSASALVAATGNAVAGTTYYDAYGNEVSVTTGSDLTGRNLYTGTPRQAYVYSNLVTTEGQMFNVSFTAVDDPTTQGS